MTVRSKTSQEQDDEDKSLIAYRLQLVELGLKDLVSRFDRQNSPTRNDLKDFQSTLLTRITEMRVDLQKQIDDKADKSAVDDLRSLVKGIGVVLGTIIAGLVVYYITNRK